MIVRTEAIVLRSMDYGETSRIVSLYTRQLGPVSVMAKGARLTKSRFGSSLQPMSYTQVVFYHRPNRSLQTLSESAHVFPLHGLARDLEKLTIGLRIVELMQALMPEEEANPSAFNLLLRTLTALDGVEERAGNTFLYFTLHLARLLGFDPLFEREAIEALPDEGGVLQLDTGAVVSIAASSAGTRASRAALRAFAICARADLETVLRMRLTPALFQETQRLIEAFLRYHVEEAYPTRAARVLGQLTSFV